MNVDNLATTIGVICGAVGTLIGGLLTLWWTKGTEARIKLIRAESDASHRSQSDVIIQKDILIAHRDQTILEKDTIISSHEKRIGKLEADYEALRIVGHEDRNTWYKDQIQCAKETADLRGQVSVLTSQLTTLYTHFGQPRSLPPHAAVTPVDVTVKNAEPISVR